MRMLLSFLLAVSITPTFAADAAGERSIAQTIAGIIKAIDDKNYLAMVEDYANPAEVAEWKKQESFAEEIAKFPEEKAAALKEILVKAKEMTPVYNDDQTEATFAVPSTEQTPENLKFIKVDGKWYVCN